MVNKFANISEDINSSVRKLWKKIIKSEYLNILCRRNFLFEPGQEQIFRGKVERIGYYYDLNTRCYRHELDFNNDKPELGKFWNISYGNSLCETLKKMEINITDVIQKDEAFKSSGCWRSSDYWILFRELRNDSCDSLRDWVSDCSSMVVRDYFRPTVTKLMLDLIEILLHKKSSHDFETDQNLTQLIDEFTLKNANHEDERKKIFDQLQPLLILADYQITSHGVTRPFCMYDSDSYCALLDDALKFVADCQMLGYDACLGFGAALGFARESELLAHDCDIDIVITKFDNSKNNYFEDRELLWDALRYRGWKLRDYLPLDSTYMPPNFYVESMAHDFNGRPFLAGLEAFFVTTSECGDVNMPHKRAPIHYSHLFPVNYINHCNRLIPLPAQVGEYCARQYGVSWEETLKYSPPWEGI